MFVKKKKKENPFFANGLLLMFYKNSHERNVIFVCSMEKSVFSKW